jgi:hypothetical protein
LFWDPYTIGEISSSFTDSIFEGFEAELFMDTELFFKRESKYFCKTLEKVFLSFFTTDNVVVKFKSRFNDDNRGQTSVLKSPMKIGDTIFERICVSVYSNYDRPNVYECFIREQRSID